MPNYDVHLYCTGRVLIEGVEAESHEKAIDTAIARFCENPEGSFADAEFADEITAARVDEEDDPEFERSVNYELKPEVAAFNNIHELLDGTEWNSDTMSRVAAIIGEIKPIRDFGSDQERSGAIMSRPPRSKKAIA